MTYYIFYELWQQKQQEELQKKLLEETEPQTLQQQENMSIKGQSARHLVMQKLMRKVEVCFKVQFKLSGVGIYKHIVILCVNMCW